MAFECEKFKADSNSDILLGSVSFKRFESGSGLNAQIRIISQKSVNLKIIHLIATICRAVDLDPGAFV